MNETARLKSVSNLLKDAWAQYKKHYESLVPIMLVAGIGMYLQTLFLFLGTDGVTVNATFGLLALIASVVYLVGMIWGYSALLNKIHKIDQPMTLAQAYTNAKPLIWPLFVTGLLVGIFTLLGLIALFIGAIVVGVFLSFAFFIVVNENKSGMEALKASKAYVSGHWWAVFGRMIVIGLVVGLAAGIIGGIAGAIFGVKLATLFQNIISLALTPLAVLYQYDLYLDVKNKKSGSASAPQAQAPQTPATPSAPQAV